ncbi:hypothetical protein MYCO108962_23645 [Mycobacterium colombiense]|uniref:Uncharacterized protein n=1 Tax=Mycobacterium colombiense CECT 3035 TaxID=1041522 RepID=J5E583_9MYCO|nr:hypothetical protein [Mycobacterium colombiense]EJO86749.1 hypothetical protein MCOL_V222608 [Mycobacterium colombiense CECT 3035]
MATAGNVLVLLGTIVTACSLLVMWHQNSDTLQKWRASLRNLGAKARRWARFGRPVHHTAEAHTIVAPTMTATARMLTPRIGTDADQLARIERAIDELANKTANERADDSKRNAEAIKQAISAYGAEQRAATRRQTAIALLGVALTIAGTVLLLLAG